MALKFDKIAFAFLVISFILDRITKFFVTSELCQLQTINQFFNIYVTHNHGIAWGIASNLESSEFNWIVLITALVLVYFAWYIKSIAHDINMLRACMLILAGGMSNFCDRLLHGSVIDFIQLHIGEWYFPVFNVADISITFGTIMLIYFALFDE